MYAFFFYPKKFHVSSSHTRAAILSSGFYFYLIFFCCCPFSSSSPLYLALSFSCSFRPFLSFFLLSWFWNFIAIRICNVKEIHFDSLFSSYNCSNWVGGWWAAYRQVDWSSSHHFLRNNHPKNQSKQQAKCIVFKRYGSGHRYNNGNWPTWWPIFLIAPDINR